MQHPGFFDRAGPFALADVARRLGADPPAVEFASREIVDVKPLSDARGSDLTFVDNRKYLPQLASTLAAACLVAPAFAARVPTGTVALTTREPYRGFALALQLFYPQAMRPIAFGEDARACASLIHPSARIEEGATVEPGAMVGREACVGRGTTIAAGAVVGYRVHVGRNSYVGPGATVIHALIGDGVVIHAGVRIGQDGFGFAMGAGGHLKVPQIGRVIIQDDVEIGANTAIDRGALKDTIIGEGSKIDNLVQIGHNVVLGRRCVIVGQVGIAGSAELGDFVVMGGQSGVAGHLRVGAGVQIAGAAHVISDVAAGMRMAGTPARPFREFGREIAALRRLAKRRGGAGGDGAEGDDG